MAADVVIKAENISKQYRLGQVGTGTLSHDLRRWWALARGKEDPYLKVGVENERTRKATSEYAWAVRDMNFEIRQGETLGIIGRNGAGKSTLLKLLSRVTSPTTGSIKVKGRIASLLEVGTGFHPELTGRENIYMNGAILGMTKKEITRKFDEIVDFAGVEMYIDTPVKRYSSGMYVRLAFGVAAHLEPEILIVDEVLAVGDAEFQKKCLGKMGDVASHGRTIIFVSHNMQAVQSLCKNTIYMRNGTLAEIGPTERVIATYLNREIKSELSKSWSNLDEAPGNNLVRLVSAHIRNSETDPTAPITVKSAFSFVFDYYCAEDDIELNLSLSIDAASGGCIFAVTTDAQKTKKGFYTSVLYIPENLMNDDVYTVNLMFVRNTTTAIMHLKDLLSFEVVEGKRDSAWFGKWPGAVRPKLEFTMLHRPNFIMPNGN